MSFLYKIFSKILFIFSIFMVTNILFSQDKFPDFFEEMKMVCEQNKYDCNSNKIVTPYLYNTFFYDHYLKVENFFHNKGFDLAQFEYCGLSSPLYNSSSTRCNTEGINVKNSPYKITKTFPKKRYFYDAFGGVNQNEGVYFYNFLNDKEIDQICSLDLEKGSKFSKKAKKFLIENKTNSLKDLRDKFYKKYDVILSQYFPKINSKYNDLPLETCMMQNRERKLWRENLISFKIKRR